MNKGHVLAGCLLATAACPAPAQADTVVVRTAAELVAAVEQETGNIEVEGVIELGRYQSGPNALPLIGEQTTQAEFGELVAIRGRDGAELRAAGAGFRLAEVLDKGRLALSDLRISGFDSPEPGGALAVRDGRLELDRVVLEGNRSGLNGGAILARGDDVELRVTDSRFLANAAEKRGGALHIHEARGDVDFERNRFADNAAAFGCAVSLRRSEGAVFNGNVFRGSCSQALVDAILGRQGFHFYRNTWVADGGLAYRYKLNEADAPMRTRMGGNVLVRAGGGPLCRLDTVGEPEFTGIHSFGGNLTTDASCGLAAETDRIVDDGSPLVAEAGVPLPLEGGAALDADALPTATKNANEGRCGIADARGLGRPQDGNGDGVAECDRGALEKRNGPDIGPAQTGAYFDPDRPGEGYFVEVLPDGRAWVILFTFQPVGGSPTVTEKVPVWLFGLGRVVGNSVVVHGVDELSDVEFATTIPGHVRDQGAFSLVFKGCESGPDSPGTAYFRSNEHIEDAAVYSDLFTDAVRLSSVVPCEGEPHPKAGLSGNFEDPQRVFEGIQVQWLPDGRVLVMWFRSGPEGRPVWLISDSATVEGSTVTAPMLYPAQPTAFGPDFDASEISLEPWGTLTLDYSSCDTVELDFESDVEGFGSGSLIYRRLTQPAGTECQL